MPSITEVDNIHEKTTDAGVTIGHDLKLSSGKSIKKADGTALLTEAGVLDNVSLGSSVTGLPSEGITHESQWRVTTEFSGAADPLNLQTHGEEVDTDGFGKLGCCGFVDGSPVLLGSLGSLS